MTAFVPLRYSLPLPQPVTDLADAAGLETLLDDVGIVSTSTGETDAAMYEVAATIAVRNVVELSVPGLPEVSARLFAGIDPTDLNEFSVTGAFLHAGGVEVSAQIPVELRLGVPDLRPAIIDAEGPRPDPAHPELRALVTAEVGFSTVSGPALSAPGGVTLPPVLLGSSGFALELDGVTVATAPFDVGIHAAVLHFPKSLHALATSVQVNDAHLNDAGFSATVSWLPPAGGAAIPLPGDLGDTLHLRVTQASVTFADSALTAGQFSVDFDDLEVPIPGLDGSALVIGAGAGLQVDLTGSAEGLGFTVRGVTAALRISPDLLRPVGSDGEVDPAAAAVELSVGTVDLGVTPGGELFFDASASALSLPRCVIGESGVIVSAEDVSLHLDDSALPAGRPGGWRGVHIGQASLTLPGELGTAVGTLSLTDADIGNGGFSGTLADAWNPALAADVAGMTFALTHVEVEFVQNALVAGAIEGTVELPFFESPIGVSIGLSLDGGFSVTLAAVQPPGTDYDGGLVSLSKPDLLDLTLDSVGFKLDDGVATVSLSGQLTPLVGGLDWPGFRVQELSIDSQGHVRLEGGWLELRDQYTLPFYGFQIEIVKIGFGSSGDGRRWIGFSGGVQLVEGLTAGASVDGLRVLWDPENGDVSLTLDGVGVEFEVPNAVYFKGSVAMTEPSPGVVRFDGQIELDITAIGLQIDAQLVIGYDSVADYTFFAIYVGVELPAGIPLGQTGLGLYGMAGLFALNMEPDKHADDAWYAIQPAPSWYHRPEIGVADLRKWRAQEGSLALGAGITLGTVVDNGYTFAGRFLFGIVFPGPILFLEGRANLLKERATLAREPLFRTLVVLDFRAGSFLMGLDVQYKIDDDGALIDIGGGAEAFFDFTNPGNWHIFFGIDEPPARRIRAELFSQIFEANAYFMLDPQRLRTGAWIGYDKRWTFGPLTVALQAWIEGGATLSWKPLYLTGYLWLHGAVELKVFGFGFSLSADARIDAGVFDPFFVRAELSVSVDLPWPLPDASADLVLAWGPEPDPPLLPVPLKEIALEHLKVTTTWPLSSAGNVLTLVPQPDGDGDGFFSDPVPAPPAANTAPPAAAPVVPLDARPRLTFGRSVHDDPLVGSNPSLVLPGSAPDPGWEWIGDPDANQGPARVRSAVSEVILQRWTGSQWDTVARSGSDGNLGGVKRLWGSWAPLPALPQGNPAPGSPSSTANVKLWLWSRSPYDFTRHTADTWSEWFSDTYPAYPCLPAVSDRTSCYRFEDLAAGPAPTAPVHPAAFAQLTIGWDLPGPSLTGGSARTLRPRPARRSG